MHSQFAALILTSMVIMGSPGPSTISATAVGASFGIRRSMRYVSGLIVGTIAVLLAVAVGVMAVVVAIPHGGGVLGAVSALYIVYLAYRIATAPPLGSTGKPIAAPGFTGGLLLAIANPKAYLAIAAVFAGTTVVASNHGRDAVAKTMLLSGMIVVIHLAWLFAGVSLSRTLQDPGRSHAVNRALAAALVVTTAIALLD
jgi:threonine/homoserine/homoserine lactone efflux protein